MQLFLVGPVCNIIYWTGKAMADYLLHSPLIFTESAPRPIQSTVHNVHVDEERKNGPSTINLFQRSFLVGQSLWEWWLWCPLGNLGNFGNLGNLGNFGNLGNLETWGIWKLGNFLSTVFNSSQPVSTVFNQFQLFSTVFIVFIHFQPFFNVFNHFALLRYYTQPL